METEALAAAAQADFSMFALFWRATFVVKIVMLVLVVASVWGWAVIVEKHRQYARARRETKRFEGQFWSGEPLDALFDEIGPAPSGRTERVFAAGMTEWRRSHKQDGAMIGGAHVRIDRSMDVAIQKEAEALQKGLPLLATIGSTAPFIGLFGTVIGIMNAFIEIGQSQSTNLAVVAPGIAEALLATGLGLLAAIPAVIFYNKLSSDSDRIIGSYESFADEFATILSRQLDNR
ncbi:MAG: protein TolQ [Silicimonas sp.]|jgi:biopolymer transport protein TolQ|nr:protein TolQ [Silicimonas sp.]